VLQCTSSQFSGCAYQSLCLLVVLCSANSVHVHVSSVCMHRGASAQPHLLLCALATSLILSSSKGTSCMFPSLSFCYRVGWLSSSHTWSGKCGLSAVVPGSLIAADNLICCCSLFFSFNLDFVRELRCWLAPRRRCARRPSLPQGARGGGSCRTMPRGFTAPPGCTARQRTSMSCRCVVGRSQGDTYSSKFN
jgi:hypothetical protein